MSLSKKGKLLALGSMSALAVSGLGVSAMEDYQEYSRLEKERIEKENKRIADEYARREALAKKYSGVHPDFIDYAYDSKVVWDKLSKGDYSNDEKIVFLTFDDGPSTTNTPEILEILEEENVKGTFFVLGKTLERDEESKEVLKNIYNNGHAVGNHSYSHDYKKLYPSGRLNLNNFIEDFNKNEKLMKEVLGENFHTRVIRCPGGYMSWRGMDELKEYGKGKDFISIDWNAVNKDAEGRKKNAQQLVQSAIDTSKNKDMVVLLMHDTYGKEETVKALPEIIKYYKDNGYKFKTLG